MTLSSPADVFHRRPNRPHPIATFCRHRQEQRGTCPRRNVNERFILALPLYYRCPEATGSTCRSLSWRVEFEIQPLGVFVSRGSVALSLLLPPAHYTSPPQLFGRETQSDLDLLCLLKTEDRAFDWCSENDCVDESRTVSYVYSFTSMFALAITSRTLGLLALVR